MCDPQGVSLRGAFPCQTLTGLGNVLAGLLTGATEPQVLLSASTPVQVPQ